MDDRDHDWNPLKGWMSLAQWEEQSPRHGKRSVSEVQLMHNVWEHKHARDRQDWLQMKLGHIHTGSVPSPGRTGPQRGPLLLDLPDSKDLTPEQITLALKLLEKVLHSRHSR
ncbi:unnamed protein product [Merluccius merluccius]